MWTVSFWQGQRRGTFFSPVKNLIPLEKKIYSELDSRLLCNAMGHPVWPQSINYNTPGMHF